MPKFYITHRDAHGERHQIGDEPFEAPNANTALAMMLAAAQAEDDGNYEVHDWEEIE